MNRMFTYTTFMLALGLSFFVIASQGIAWDERQSSQSNPSYQSSQFGTSSQSSRSTQMGQNNQPQSGNLVQKTGDKTIRTSKLIGMTVWNAQGKEIGQINDFVIDDTTGKIRYAALSYGGLWGMGDKLFAVPWKAFKCEPSKEGEDPKLILNVSEETIKNSEGFDKANWPDFANRKLTDKIDRHFGVQCEDDTQRSNTGVNSGI